MIFRGGAAFMVVLTGLWSCGGTGEPETESSVANPPSAVAKGGDGRFGDYESVSGWWKMAPEHDDRWTWGNVSGLAVDSPDRIIVAVWGDRDSEGTKREGGSNYLVVVDREGTP